MTLVLKCQMNQKCFLRMYVRPLRMEIAKFNSKFGFRIMYDFRICNSVSELLNHRLSQDVRKS
jgi:hypothetical protein